MGRKASGQKPCRQGYGRLLQELKEMRSLTELTGESLKQKELSKQEGLSKQELSRQKEPEQEEPKEEVQRRELTRQKELKQEPLWKQCTFVGVNKNDMRVGVFCEALEYILMGAQDKDRLLGYVDMYQRMGANAKTLEAMYNKHKMCTTLTPKGVTLEYGNESWRLEVIESCHKVRLLHNNYRVAYTGLRVRVEGWHIQKRCVSFKEAIDNIVDYISHGDWVV